MWQKLWVKLIRFSGLSVEHSLALTVSWWNSGTVRPHLEYGNVVWHSYLNKDMQLLEGVQQRATRMVPGLSKLYYKQRLKLMDLSSLFYRRMRGDVIEVVYKFMNGIYKVNSADILPRHRTAWPAARGHNLIRIRFLQSRFSSFNLKLEKRDCKNRIRANLFGYRIVNVWNSLPEDVVTASSVNSLKGRLDSRVW